MTTPVLASADPIIIDHVRALAAAGNASVMVLSSLIELGPAWHQDGLLLLGSDLIDEVQGLPKRRNVAIVHWQFDAGQEIPTALWASALALGAEHVVALPKADDWLAERITPPTYSGNSRARVLAVGAVCGGAGASTFAVGMAIAAKNAGHRVLLIDADLAGGGLDLLLGAETMAGVRWPELAFASGRMSAETLVPALPMPHGISLVTASRDRYVTPTQEAWLALLEFAVHSFDLVVLDLGREELPSTIQSSMAEFNASLMWVVPTRIRAIAAASLCLERSQSIFPNQEVIVRKVDRSMNANDVGRALGRSVLKSVPEDSQVVAASEQGIEVKGAYAKACAEIFRAWWVS